MKATLEFEIGKETCFSEPGKPCKFIITKCFGSIWMCSLFFDKHGEFVKLFENNKGWLKLCPECLSTFPPT